MSDAWYYVWTIAIVIAIVALLAAVVGVPYYLLDRAGCERSADRLQTEAQYDWWSGCHVKIDGHFVPLDNVRITDDGEVIG